MRKLLFILLLLPLFCLAQTQLSINQVAPNFRTGGIWKPMGTMMTPDLVADGNNLQEPCVLYEGSPQLITDATNVFKMIFTAGGTTEGIYYAESTDGQIWIRQSAVCIANHARTTLYKEGSTYYCFCVPTTGGGAFGQVDVYSSTNMTTWTLAAAAIITKGAGGTWNGNSLANMCVIKDGSTYQMLLSANNGSTSPFTTGYYSSTSITSGWTAYGSNPVLGTMNTNGMQASYFTKVGSTYYAWAFGSTTSNILPSDIYRFHSTNLTSWTIDNSGNPVYPRTQGDEGLNQSGGQAANPWLVEVSGKTHLFFSAVTDGNGLAPGLHLKHAIANYTIANLALTNEGNGGAFNYAQPQAYSRVASDLNYIPNATNVGANGTWTTASVLIQDAAGYGFRTRDPSATTTLSALIPGALYLYKTNLSSFIQANTTNLTISAYGGINFNNGSGSGAASLGNFDNTGLLTTTNGVTIQGGAFNYQSGTAFGASATFGLTLRNQSAATAGIPVRWSPAAYRNGTAWDLGTLASKQMYAYDLLEPISANPASYKWVWRGDNNFGGDLDLMTLAEGGNLTTTGSITVGTVVQNHGYTVSTLPTASSNKGATAYVTDATSPAIGSTVSGGGSAFALVVSNGTNWTVTGI